MRRLAIVWLLFSVGWVAASSAAYAEKRLALVIAVQGYESLPKLENTIADAELIAAKLGSAGFEVEVEKDVSKVELQTGIRRFGHKIEAAGTDVVGLIYYAGHGVQDEKQINYVVGVDAQLKSDIDLPIEALSIDTILRTLEQAKPKLLFAIFDACRDDPMPSSPSRGVRRGPLRKLICRQAYSSVTRQSRVEWQRMALPAGTALTPQRWPKNSTHAALKSSGRSSWSAAKSWT